MSSAQPTRLFVPPAPAALIASRKPQPREFVFDATNEAMTFGTTKGAVWLSTLPSIKNYPIVPHDPSNLADMGPVIQAALDDGVRDFSDVNLYIDSAVTIPNNAIVTWSPQGEIIPKTEGFINRHGIWAIGPNAAVNWGRDTTLICPSVIHKDFMIPPAITGDATKDVPAAAARLAARVANGTGMLLNRPDVLLVNPFVVGFNTAYVMNAERIRLSYPRADCINGIEGFGIGDCCYVDRLHFWPYWFSHIDSIPPAGVLGSYQKGLYFHDKADGVQIDGGLIYGMAISEHYRDVYGLKAKGVWLDGDPTIAADRGTIGVLTEGNCQFLDLSHTHTNSHAISRKFYHTGGTVIWSDNTSSDAQVADTLLGTGHSTGSISVENAKGSALITLSDAPGIHDVYIRNEGGAPVTAGVVVNASAVTTKTQLNRVKLQYTDIGSGYADNTSILSSYVLAVSNADQQVAANTATHPNFVTTTDTLGEWNGTTFTAAEAGDYYFDVDLAFTASANTSVLLQVMRSGTEYRRVQQQVLAGAGSVALGRIVRMSAGATLTVLLTMGASGSLTNGVCKLKVARRGA